MPFGSPGHRRAQGPKNHQKSNGLKKRFLAVSTSKSVDIEAMFENERSEGHREAIFEL